MCSIGTTDDAPSGCFYYNYWHPDGIPIMCFNHMIDPSATKPDPVILLKHRDYQDCGRKTCNPCRKNYE